MWKFFESTPGPAVLRLDRIGPFRGRETIAIALIAVGALCNLAPTRDEVALRAAFAFKIAGFAQWEAQEEKPEFCFRVIDDEAFAKSLEELVAGQRLHDAPVVVRRGSPPDVARCQVWWAGDPAALGSAATRPPRGVVTMSAAAGFAKRGGVVELVRDGARLRFEVNIGSGSRAGVRFSSKLLRLASEVHRSE